MHTQIDEPLFDIVLPPQPQPARPTIRQRIVGKINRTIGRHISSSAKSIDPIRYPKVELSYWRPASGVNFGDEIARTVVILMLAQRGMTLEDQSTRQPQLLSVGSVLQMARNGAVIWGSGLNGAVSEADHLYKELDVRAVRGPITRQFLKRRGISVPEVYGDPALLIPHLTGDRFKHVEQTNEVGLVPNLFDMKSAREAIERHPEMKLIDPMRSWEVVIHEIVQCKFIVSSSLHGIIIAETFGIPARFIRFTEHESRLKYQDYYLGTGRNFAPAASIENAIDLGGQAPLNLDLNRLMSAFPYDLWDIA